MACYEKKSKTIVPLGNAWLSHLRKNIEGKASKIKWLFEEIWGILATLGGL